MSQLLRHFGFRTHPFHKSAPRSALYRHRGFEEALSRLRFTVELDSIAVLLAESGCGKSLLLGELAEEVRGQGWLVHYFSYSSVGPFSLINMIARRLGRSPCRSRGETADLLAQTLLEDERSHLLILDEAHELPGATLEDLRLLTIADFDRKSPFLLLLAGQLPLEDRLADPGHHAFQQRITTVARLQPLSEEETSAYLQQRLEAAGVKSTTPVFENSATEALFDSSGGVPRRINQLATAALIVAASRQRKLVSGQDVHDARLDRGRA
jgi:general secretion pathway protein A